MVYENLHSYLRPTLRLLKHLREKLLPEYTIQRMRGQHFQIFALKLWSGLKKEANYPPFVDGGEGAQKKIMDEGVYII